MADEPAARDCGFTVAETDPSAGDTAAERVIGEAELIWVVWIAPDAPPPAVHCVAVRLTLFPSPA